MINIRRSGERGRASHGWLLAKHSFSFANYYDPQHMGHGALRVINEDVIQAGQGFGTHPHRDMEILTYVLEGGVAHRDSMGNGSTIVAGELQRMSAGTGVTHSEFNASSTEPLHLLQIWLLPDRAGHEPGYEQTLIEPAQKRGRLHLAASQDGGGEAMRINQDADVYVGEIDGDERARLDLRPGRDVWLQVARGSIHLNGQPLAQGDGAALVDERVLELSDGVNAEVLVFDMAPLH